MSRRESAALGALAVFALALRCAHLIDYDEDIDSLRFALGVERFDVSSLRPHTPYYPVFIGAAKLLAGVGASPRLALGLVVAFSGACVVVLTALLARELRGHRAALVAGALALASPYLWLSSQKLLSDIPGTALFTLGLWLCVRARRGAGEGRDRGPLRTAAMVIFGVALGVRLSYWPIALACTAVVASTEGGGRAWLARTRDLLSGVTLWLLPLVVVGGAPALVRTTWVQAVGHFTRWGGSVATVASPVERIGGGVWGLWANLLGGPWGDAPAWRWLITPSLLALLVGAARDLGGVRASARRQPELVVSAIAYFLWAALGQNTAYKPRHWLPLAPLIIVAMAVGTLWLTSRWRAGSLAVPVLCAGWLLDGFALVRAHRQPSPVAALVRFLHDGGAGDRPISTCALDRMIAVGAPSVTVVRVESLEHLARSIDRAGASGMLLTSECLAPAEREALVRRGVVVQVLHEHPRSRYVDPLWPTLSLLRLTCPARFSP